MKTDFMGKLKNVKEKVISYAKDNKRKVIIGTSCIAAVLVVLSVSAVIFFNKNTATDKKITNEDITISGALGNTEKITKEEVDDTSNEYGNAKEKIDNEGLISFKVYDISLYNKQNEKVQPDGTVSIMLKLPEELRIKEDEEIMVYRTESDSSLTKLQCKVEDNKIIFDTEHFSIYTVAKYNKQRGLASLKTNGIDDYVTSLDKTMYALDDVNVMSGPNSTFDTVGTLTKNQLVKVVGQYEENGWYKVNLEDNTIGYVSDNSLIEEKPEEEKETEADEKVSSQSENISSSKEDDDKSTAISSNTDNKATNKATTDNTSAGNSSKPSNKNENKKNTENNMTEKNTAASNNNSAKNNVTASNEAKPTQSSTENNNSQKQEETKKNNCPYPLLTWTTYQGHEGFFASNKQSSQGGKANDMETELYLKKGSDVQAIQMGYYDDVGVVAFYY